MRMDVKEGGGRRVGAANIENIPVHQHCTQMQGNPLGKTLNYKSRCSLVL